MAIILNFALGCIALLFAWLCLRALVAVLDVLVLHRIPTTRWMRWVCWLNGHDNVDHVSDAAVPYRNRCVRCGWRHPLDGQ